MWAILVFVPIGYLMSEHYVVLPVAEERIEFAHSIPTEASAWKILHVLGEDCKCSRDVLAYLEERGISSAASEAILLLGGKLETKLSLESRGFIVEISDAEELCVSYGSEGVPYFQISDETNVMRYSGAYSKMGYSTTRGYLDLKNLELAKQGIETPNLPVLGCATSRRLRGALDPLALKYDF